MKSLIDREVAEDFLDVGKAILFEHFLFDKNECEEFCKKFVASLNCEHTDLVQNGSRHFKVMMWTDCHARHIFTCNFAGLHLLKVLQNHYYFSVMELNLFEELLSKYVSEVVEMIEIAF